MKIDKGIPLTNNQAGRKGGSKWDGLMSMEAGDSVWVDTTKPAVASAIRSWAKKNKLPWKFACRAEGKGHRIWRTE